MISLLLIDVVIVDCCIIQGSLLCDGGKHWWLSFIVIALCGASSCIYRRRRVWLFVGCDEVVPAILAGNHSIAKERYRKILMKIVCWGKILGEL